MGCDSRLYLPPVVGVREVATALAILLGGRPVRTPLQGGGWYCDAEPPLGLAHGTALDGVIIEGEVAGKEVYNRWYWEGEGTGEVRGYRLMACGYMPARLPALRRLADFFGGVLDERDCDDAVADYAGTLEGKAYRPDATADAEWDAFQEALFGLGEDPGVPYPWPS